MHSLPGDDLLPGQKEFLFRNIASFDLMKYLHKLFQNQTELIGIRLKQNIKIAKKVKKLEKDIYIVIHTKNRIKDLEIVKKVKNV